MKQCPNCKTIFTDDLFYCLNDGVPLTGLSEGVDRSAPTDVAFNVGRTAPTEVLPNAGRPARVVPYQEPPPQNSSSKVPYLVIGVLTLVCVALGAVIVVMNRDRIFPTQDATNKAAKDARLTPASSPTASNTPAATNALTSGSPKVKQPAVTVNPAGKWKGEWSTTSGTVLDIEITLNDAQNNSLDGQIRWTLRKTVRPDKTGKIGLSATEFVRGTFDPAGNTVNMSGYRKDDPDGVLVMLDDYNLTVSQDGRSLTGLARNGGKWNGHLRLTR